MTRFEYLSVLVSIVIALGISELTISWARVFQLRAEVRTYWLHAFWSVFSLFLLIQFWWGFWRYRTVETWSLSALIMALSVVITLSLCVLMLAPRVTPDMEFDSRKTYFDNAPKFFFLAATFILMVTAMDILVLGSSLLKTENVFRAAGAVTAMGMTRVKNEKFHVGFAILGVLILVGFMATTRVY